MEAAAAASRLPARLRARRAERELMRLRPLGETYVLRRFGRQLGRADAEDAVAEVLASLHQRIAAGHEPDNLRAMFFTAAHNAAIDILRSRAARPSAPLEEAPAPVDRAPQPAELAERGEGAARLQEMLARMRPNYGEAIVLRFGLGLTVPEIAEHFAISLPAAKKLMLRATSQARKRMAGIEGERFCPEMRDLARRSLAEREACGLAEEAEAEVLRAHVAHCATCRSFVAKLHQGLHELGAAGLPSLLAGDRVAHGGALEGAGQWLGTATDTLGVAAERARELALRASGPLGPGEGAAGALLGSGQKLAAICGTAGAATATCLITGAVGPGLGAGTAPSQAEQPPPRVRSVQAREVQPASEPAPPVAAEPEPPARPEPEPEPEPAAEALPPAPPESARPAASPPEPEPPPSEFGLEGSGAGSGSSEPSTAPEGNGDGDFGAPAPGGSRPSGSGEGSAGVGFQG